MTFRKCHSEGAFSATEESRSIEKLKIPRQSKKSFSVGMTLRFLVEAKKTAVKLEIPPIVGMTFRKCHSEGAFSATEESRSIEKLKIPRRSKRTSLSE
jgi:hypothetical protein